MSTTSLFIELLVSGLQAIIWLFLFILCLFGFDWINLERVKGFESAYISLFLAVLYPAGILTDYLADALFGKWENNIRQKYILRESQSAMRLLIETKEPALASHLGYLRNRIRICRSSALNFALILVLSITLTIIRFQSLPSAKFWKVIFVELLIGLFFVSVAILAWRKISYSFFKWVARMHNPSAIVTDDGIIEDAILESKATTL